MDVATVRIGWKEAIRALREGAEKERELRAISPRDARGMREAADYLDRHWPVKDHAKQK